VLYVLEADEFGVLAMVVQHPHQHEYHSQQ